MGAGIPPATRLPNKRKLAARGCCMYILRSAFLLQRWNAKETSASVAAHDGILA